MPTEEESGDTERSQRPSLRLWHCLKEGEVGHVYIRIEIGREGHLQVLDLGGIKAEIKEVESQRTGHTRRYGWQQNSVAARNTPFRAIDFVVTQR